MTAALQPQDLTLTIFGAHVRGPGDTAWSGGMVQILGEFGFSAEASRAALARLVTRGLLRRHKDGRLVFYALTPRAQELLAEGDERIFNFGRAPRADRWTVLWHTIPEDRRVERSRLAARLRFLGFGSVQDASWIAAGDLEVKVLRILGELEVQPFASILVGELSATLGAGALVEQAWDLGGVEQGYGAFLEEYQALRGQRAQRRLDERAAFVARTQLLHGFRGFAFLDPELPEGARALDRLRAKVVDTFDAVYAGLAEPAERHFAAVARPEPVPVA
ncbi:MAG TPA: PaaX family transcriptional regulator C-terminal domain-containing protein [Solirubrobacteraceae bacterium]|nr:PaaX family transcriptional regulator C-terminal domain-containing protein [Solirubrobacteraceae bacterium]